MKKKVLLLFMLIVLLIVTCVALVACGESNCKCSPAADKDTSEKRTAFIAFHYTITTQFAYSDTYIIGSLMYKPENPTYINKIFNDGYNVAANGNIPEFEMPIENPRMEPGYESNKNYKFIAWYTEPEFLYQWDFGEDRIYRDMTLYAKWVEC